MTRWYTHDVCELTGISARTLQHYDKIGLLKASTRLPNGYRVYSETDLIKLQQILALKSFGFELSKIKAILSGKIDISQLLQMQKDFLQQKTQQLKEAIDILTAVIDDSKLTGSVDLSSTLNLIGVYKMTKELEQSWAGKIFTPEQLKKFAAMPKLSGEELIQYEKEWDILVAEVKLNIHEDPYGVVGQSYAKQWMDLANRYWEDHELGEVIWDCYKQGKFEEPSLKESDNWHNIPQDVVHWIDKAVGFMYSGKKK